MKKMLQWFRSMLGVDQPLVIVTHGEMRLAVLELLFSRGPLSEAELKAILSARLSDAQLDGAPVEDVLALLTSLDYIRERESDYSITQDGAGLLEAAHALLEATPLHLTDGLQPELGKAVASIHEEMRGFYPRHAPLRSRAGAVQPDWRFDAFLCE